MSLSPSNTYFAESAKSGDTTTLSSSITVGSGDLIVVKAQTWDATTAAGTPSGGSLTYTRQVTTSTTGFATYGTIFTATASSGTTFTVTLSAPAASCYHSMLIEVWPGAQVAATPATATAKYSAASLPSMTITTTGTGSAVTSLSGDAQSLAPGTPTYSSGGTGETFANGSTGSDSVQYYWWQNAATAGSQTVGMGAPAGQKWNMASLEIQASSSTTPISSSDTGTGTDAGTVTASTSSSDTGTATDAGSVTAAITSAETATATDSSGTVAALTSSAETGAATENQKVLPQSSDSGTASESAIVGPVSADTAVATETQVVMVFSSDSAVATDSGVVGATLSSADTGAASDVGIVLAAISQSDTATATDANGPVVVGIFSSDSATATDAVSLLRANLTGTETGTATDGQSVSTGTNDVVDGEVIHVTEGQSVTIERPKVKVYPYYIRETQPWAIEQERRRHNQALWYVGETTMFALMWHIEDFNSGLVGRCRSCYTSQGAITEVYGQSDQNKCPDCFGTTFDGGFKALIIRPAIFSDTDESETFHSRGVIHPNDLAIESTPDFRVRNGDYCFRQTGERYYLRVPERITLRTGYSLPTQQDHAIGYNHANAAVEDPTAVAYLIPPPQDEVNTILRRASRIPRDWSSYEVIRAPLIPLNFQPPDA